MSEGNRAKKRGRPALPEGEGKLYAVSGFRTTKQVKDFLQQRADSSGGSIAQEVEARLLDSFDFEGMLGGPRATRFFRILAKRIELVTKNESWLDDYQSYQLVRGIVLKTFDELAPPRPDPLDLAVRQARDGLRTILSFKGGEDFLGPELRGAVLQLARALANDPQVPADVRADLFTSLAEIDRGEA
jgi:hypothetical protein